MTIKTQSETRNKDREIERLSANEIAWVEFLRLCSRNTDPAPTLTRIQALRRMFSNTDCWALYMPTVTQERT